MVTPIECMPRYFYATIRSRDRLAVLELVLTSRVLADFPLFYIKLAGCRPTYIPLRHRLVADLLNLLKSPGKYLSTSHVLAVSSHTKHSQTATPLQCRHTGTPFASALSFQRQLSPRRTSLTSPVAFSSSLVAMLVDPIVPLIDASSTY